MQKTCRHCSSAFEVTEDDLAFYEKVSPVFNGKTALIPPPTMCPDCRLRQRLMFRNLRNLHHRTCDKTGKAIISCYESSSPHAVYHNSEWWSDSWDALEYGRDFDFSRTFSEQFLDLYRAVPTVHQYATNDIENCEFVNGASHCKNCYVSFMMDYCENCYYVSYAEHNHMCIDCLGTHKCEHCYECVDCRDCYGLLFSQRSIRCLDSMFLSDCLRCKNCIGCTNLVDKEFHIFNKPCSPQEFERHKRELLGGKNLNHTLNRFREWSSTTPKKYYFGSNNEDFSGDSITNCKNSYQCFDANDLEDCKYCTYVFKSHHCVDHHVYGDNASWIYSCVATGGGVSNNAFCLCCWNGSNNNYYCHLISACTNCFGCSGLKNKNYCIFNKQYTKEQYDELVPKIIEHMKKTGEWGEYFSPGISPFGYNISEAQEYFPLDKQEVERQGWAWQEEDNTRQKYLGPIPVIPDQIKDVHDDICSAILLCETTGKPYKIIPQELAFYRERGIPIPRRCPDQRHRDRMMLRNPRKLWRRNCAECAAAIETTYAPDRPEIVYCERCYLSAIH